MDIFGLQESAGEPAAAISAGAVRKSAAGKAWWALFLALDTAALCVLGGSTAVLWIHRPKPPIVATRIQRALPKTPPPPAAPQPAAVKKEVPPKSAEPAKAASPKLPVGSPQVAAPDLPRRQAQPAGGDSAPSGSSKSPQTAGGKPKAVPVAFTCAASSSAQKVLLKGPFLVRTGGVKAMVQDANGNWHLTVSLLPGAYKYSCVVDGKKSKPLSINVQ